MKEFLQDLNEFVSLFNFSSLWSWYITTHESLAYRYLEIRLCLLVAGFVSSMCLWLWKSKLWRSYSHPAGVIAFLLHPKPSPLPCGVCVLTSAVDERRLRHRSYRTFTCRVSCLKRAREGCLTRRFGEIAFLEVCVQRARLPLVLLSNKHCLISLSNSC